jgi:hypothetical protein
MMIGVGGNRDNDMQSGDLQVVNVQGIHRLTAPQIRVTHGAPELLSHDNLDHMSASDEGLYNRRLRPGFVNSSAGTGTPERRNSRSSHEIMLHHQLHEAPPVVVDGFDYNKDSPPNSPFPGNNNNCDDSLRDLPLDNRWPNTSGSMTLSPLPMHRNLVLGSAPNVESDDQLRSNPSNHDHYGSIENEAIRLKIDHPRTYSDHAEDSPLLGRDIPPEVITRRLQRGRSHSVGEVPDKKEIDQMPKLFAWDKLNRRLSFHPRDVTKSVFNEVHTHNESEDVAVHHESEEYMKSGTFARGTFSLLCYRSPVPGQLCSFTLTLCSSSYS